MSQEESCNLTMQEAVSSKESAPNPECFMALHKDYAEALQSNFWQRISQLQSQS